MEQENLPVGQLSIIGLNGCESFALRVDEYIRQWREDDRTYLTKAACPRFGTGEGKGIVYETVRGHDLYLICDPFNYGVTYRMYGMDVPMSPDDHYQDLKRIIGAAGGKQRRTTVIMPMLYESRQHRRAARESLDCAAMLQELVALGVTQIITFDAHDGRVANAIPSHGIDNIQPTYQMLKAIKNTVPDVNLTPGHTVIISPDEGGISRCMYYSSVLGLDLGTFYKRRDYETIIDGRNPIIAHEFLGNDLNSKDAIIVDDMISSGDSILDICEQLKSRGVGRIFIFATFGLFCNGLEHFDRAFNNGMFDKIFTTNLIYQTPELQRRDWYRSVDMTKLVAYLIDALNFDKSIYSFLDPIDRINRLLGRE